MSSFIPKKSLLQKGLYFNKQVKIPYLKAKIPYFFKLQRSFIDYSKENDQISLVYEYYGDKKTSYSLTSTRPSINYLYTLSFYLKETEKSSRPTKEHVEKLENPNYDITFNRLAQYTTSSSTISKALAQDVITNIAANSALDKPNELNTLLATLRSQVDLLEESLLFLNELKNMTLPIKLSSYNIDINKEKLVSTLEKHHFPKERSIDPKNLNLKNLSFKLIVFSKLSSPDLSINAEFDLKKNVINKLSLDVEYLINQEDPSSELKEAVSNFSKKSGLNSKAKKVGPYWVLKADLLHLNKDPILTAQYINKLVNLIDFSVYK
ncbi:MAG: hypothetical protein ACRBBP_11775 [Bdellovibrionales bacterium]